MKKTILISIITSSLFYTGISAASNDYDKEPAKWWANVTSGRGASAINRQSTGHSTVFSFNGAFSENVYGSFYKNATSTNVNDEYSDIGLMVGYRHNASKGYYGISSGIGYMNHWYSYGYLYSYGGSVNQFESEGVVVPIQVQAFWTPFKHVGFGATAHAAFGKANYGGVQIGIQLYS